MRPLNASRRPVLALSHRDDLQGLRAVAVLLVALNHAGVPHLTGGYTGVDVFFVLSGFLITSLLLNQAAKDGRISLPDFYRRRARRILPAAALTLIATDIAAWQLLNFVRAKQTVLDSLWASGFAANIHFGRENADYFARALGNSSPLQHFWTLSVEEQFYLAWPLVLSLLLFGAAYLWGRRAGEGVSEAMLQRALVFIVLAGVASLAWSIHYTDANRFAAYFSTFARAWELALGAGLAIAAPRLTRLPRDLRFVAGWAGLGCIVAAAVLFSSTTAFPGYAALLPTVGAALVIAAGIGARPAGFDAGRLLSLAPMRYVGDRSYAFYLWHWPVLILALEYEGHPLATSTNLLFLCEAFVLSVVSYAWFEDPIRRGRFGRSLGLLLWPAAVVAVVAIALPILGDISSKIDAASAGRRNQPLRPGGLGKPLPAVLAAVRAAENRAPIPWPLRPGVNDLEAGSYNPQPGCVAGDTETSSRLCPLGDLGSSRTLVVLGDSHALMWMPTIVKIARTEHWRLVPLIKTGCPPKFWVHASAFSAGTGLHCDVWYRWAISRATALGAKAYLIAGKWSEATPKEATSGIDAAVTALRAAGGKVVVVGDPVVTLEDPVDCLLAAGATMKTCTPRAASSTLETNHAVTADTYRLGGAFIGVRGWFCAPAYTGSGTLLCPDVVNRTIVRRDFNHVSAAYALELTPFFSAALRSALSSQR
jgi:peptidoglycan/LPS O-acetylase OafA/YrhL